MKKKVYLISAGAILVIATVLFFTLRNNNSSNIIIKPKRGPFYVSAISTGELQSISSIDIQGPQGARQIGIWQMKIQRIVPEGTLVKEGDFVAELDKSEIMNKIKEIELQVQKYESQYLQTKLDSTLNLSNARDELENLKYSTEEKQLIKEQSAFEAPAIIRQAEIDYERSDRAYNQAVKNYTTKVQQAIAKLSEVGADLSKEKANFQNLMSTLQEFTIKAPASGMVIYTKDWNGKKRGVGSTINAWDPVVATLPDLTKMESITYINEVDIKKVKKDQFVKIKLDADSKKNLTGVVSSVANVGEQRPNSDSKVFETHIKINEIDTTLRPSMTTSNEILNETIQNVLSIPIEAMKNENGCVYVFKKQGSKIFKQEIKIGAMNENDVIIEQGISDNDEILLNEPENAKDLKLIKLK